MNEIVTSTGQWSLVVQRVSASTVEVWVGTLFPSLKMPKSARVKLVLPDGSHKYRQISKKDWHRPFRKMKQRFYAVCRFTHLDPSTHYELLFERKVEALGGLTKSYWQGLRWGCFDTLPSRLPASGEASFTIGMGSCFYNHRDGGQAAGSYRSLYDRGDAKVRPDITFLTGDQVYLDIGFDSLSLIPDEIRQRIADDYALHWQALGEVLNRGGTWMLPDDHEYWNDYPFYDSLIPTLLALKLPWVRKSWKSAAQDAVKNIQCSPVVEVINLGSDLSICLADLRSYRSKNGFLPKEPFKRLLDWAHGLKQPGVLVIPQPLIVEENKTERNLLSFSTQYRQLLNALASSGHDVVLLSGDVHFGRIASVDIGNKGGRLIEVVSSPLSNLTGLNGIATAKPSSKPKYFPDRASSRTIGWTQQNVKYDKTFQVSTKKGRLASAYPRDRTREHFMTVGFNRNRSGGVDMAVNAWRVRQRSSSKNLPMKDFTKAFKYSLR